MEVIYVLLSISISVALFFFATFIYAVRSGQYDDTYSPAVRILFEEKPKTPNQTKPTESTTTSTLHGDSAVLLRQQDR
jgi:cbb3-type cytochrome oxidase maturation protein